MTRRDVPDALLSEASDLGSLSVRLSHAANLVREGSVRHARGTLHRILDHCEIEACMDVVRECLEALEKGANDGT